MQGQIGGQQLLWGGGSDRAKTPTDLCFPFYPMLKHRGTAEDTPSGGSGGKLNGGAMISVYTQRALLTPVHCAICTLCTPPPCTGGKNTVRKTRRMPWLMETDSSDPLILFDACCLPAKPKVSLIHVCIIWLGLCSPWGDRIPMGITHHVCG